MGILPIAQMAGPDDGQIAHPTPDRTAYFIGSDLGPGPKTRFCPVVPARQR